MLRAHGQAARKPYSIALAPAQARERGYLEFLIKTDGETPEGRELAALRRGARVEAHGPIGAFVLPDRPVEHHLLFIAGGAGIAPLRAMLWQVLARRSRLRVTVVYSARSPRHFAYLAELRRLATARRIELVLRATRRAPAGWRGDRGRPDTSLLRALIQSPATLCFLCGPPGLVAGAASRLRRIGIAAKRIRMEKW